MVMDEPIETMSTVASSNVDGNETSLTPLVDRPDLSTSYDELMQTVIWVPPTTSTKSVVKAVAPSAVDACQAGNGVPGRMDIDVDVDVEATESARDVAGDWEPRQREERSSSMTPKSLLEENRVRVNGEYSLEEPISLAGLERNVFELAEKFRKGVMGEMEAMKDSLSRRHEAEIRALKEEHGRQLAALSHQLSRQRDLNETFGKTLARKEETIDNLLQCLAKEKDKGRLARHFASWREKTQDSDKFETPQWKMARKFHELLLKRRAWTAWSDVARTASRSKFEARLREETRQKLDVMEKECDARMLTLQAGLRNARAEVEALKGERESHEERVKAALMRGVCALNVETMSVLSGGGGGSAHSVKSSASVDDGSLNASSIHATQNGSIASTARGDSADVDRSSKEQNGRRSLDDHFCSTSTPEASTSIPSHRLVPKTSLDSIDTNLSARSNSSHSFYQQSLQQQSHPRPAGRSVYQSSTSRRSCGVNPVGNVPKEKGAQVKSLPHSTIVIERHVDRT